MKSFPIQSLLAVALLAGTCLYTALPADAAIPPKFSDLGGSYSQAEIQQLVQRGILSGYEDGTFRPGAAMTRQEFAKVLALSMGLTPDRSAAAAFTDIAEWARPYVGALVKAGITKGVSTNQYGSLQPVSREQLAVFFTRAFGVEALANRIAMPAPFTDRDTIAGFAAPSAALAKKTAFLKGVTNADGTLSFDPRGIAQRQAVARLAYEYTVNGEVYRAQYDQMAEADDLLTKMEAAMDALESYQVQETTSYVSSIGESPSRYESFSDVVLQPYTAHTTGTGTSTGRYGDVSTFTYESYVWNDRAFYEQHDQTWDVIPHGPYGRIIGRYHNEAYLPLHYLAPYLKISSDENTITLSGRITPSEYLSMLEAGILRTAGEKALTNEQVFTLVLDKATHRNIKYHRVETQSATNQTYTTERILHSFNEVPPIDIPQSVKDAYEAYEASLAK